MTNKQIIYIILHNIRSAYNVGSIFRTADAVGIAKIYVCGYSPTPNEQRVVKTALGAEKAVPWEQHKQTWRLLKKLSKTGVYVIALEQTDKSKNIFKYNFDKINKPIALLIGHERKGLSREILKFVDAVVEIPMYGQKESLNVSVATGIALYEIKRASKTSRTGKAESRSH